MSQRATQEELDMRQLMASPAFRRFLLRLCDLAGIWIPTAGADLTLSRREGARSLGLDILRSAAAGMPQRDRSIERVIALVLSEATTPKETDDDGPEEFSRDRN